MCAVNFYFIHLLFMAYRLSHFLFPLHFRYTCKQHSFKYPLCDLTDESDILHTYTYYQYICVYAACVCACAYRVIAECTWMRVHSFSSTYICIRTWHYLYFRSNNTIEKCFFIKKVWKNCYGLKVRWC